MILPDFGEQMFRAVECWKLVRGRKKRAEGAGDWQETSLELPL